MERTQIYLTEQEMKAVRSIAHSRGKTQSEVIRDAIDRFVARETLEGRRALLSAGRGLWRDRQDLPDLDLLRGELDRTGAAPSES